MRIGWVLALGMGGCSGGKDTAGDSGAPTDEPVVIDCALPQYELGELDCEELAYSFEQLTNYAADCNTDEDCQAVRPACEQWDAVECYYPVNYCFTADLVSTYNAESGDCSSIGGQTFVGCTCGEEPPVVCVDHKCELG
jgi:hypothetical protein